MNPGNKDFVWFIFVPATISHFLAHKECSAMLTEWENPCSPGGSQQCQHTSLATSGLQHDIGKGQLTIPQIHPKIPIFNYPLLAHSSNEVKAADQWARDWHSNCEPLPHRSNSRDTVWTEMEREVVAGTKDHPLCPPLASEFWITINIIRIIRIFCLLNTYVRHYDKYFPNFTSSPHMNL